MCLEPTNSLFENERKEMERTGESNLYGKIFQHQYDYSKLSFELGITLERIFHGAFENMTQ